METITTLSPDLIYHSHSRLEGVFSGCGKTIEGTLQDLMTGRIPPDAIPLISVLQLPTPTPDSPRFVSLNNRRLYVFKELHKANKLKDGLITCRCRVATKKEAEKYLKQTLALNARIKKAQPSPGKGAVKKLATGGGSGGGGGGGARKKEEEEEVEEED